MNHDTRHLAALMFVEMLTGREKLSPNEIEFLRHRLRQQGFTTRQVNAKIKKLLSGFSDTEAAEMLKSVQDSFFDVRS
jgi:uncharacterized protein YcgL (UPF0745 family)